MHNIVLLQDYWLLPFDLGFLSDISEDFFPLLDCWLFVLELTFSRIDHYGGRPYFHPYRKQFAKLMSIIDVNEPRLCCVRINTCVDPVLIINAYMPCDANDDASYDEYIDLCTKINAIFTDTGFVYLVVMGDFNCKPLSLALHCKFNYIFMKLMSDCDLVCADILKLNDVLKQLDMLIIDKSPNWSKASSSDVGNISFS